MGKLEKVIVENGLTYVLGVSERVQTWILYGTVA